MKKIITLLLLLSVVINSCKSKLLDKRIAIGDIKEINYIPYYLKVHEADSLYIVGNYKQSHHILDSLFRKFKPLNQNSYGEYGTYIKNKVVLKDFKNIKDVLKRAIQEYGCKVKYCLTDTILMKAVSEAKFSENDLNGFYDVYTKSLNLEYRYAIEKMIENDQRVRRAVPVDPEEWKKVDKENAQEIEQLILKYGFPSVQKIGRHDFTKNSADSKILFLHAKKEARERYILKLLLDSVKKGECEPENFATVYDKYLIMKGFNNKVLYGEIRNPREKLDQVVMNPKKLDSIRKSVGLEHIEYKRWKLKKLAGININELNQ